MPFAEPTTQEPPFTLGGGRYEATAQLAEGGTARVFLGIDHQTGARCAIKVLRPDLLPERDVRERLRAEASTMQALRHRHVLRVLAAGQDGSRVWFAMELGHRGSVDDWVAAHGPIPASVSVTILLAVCSALGHAHGNGIIHRDVTTRNLLVDGEGVVKVGDFGTARILGRRITRTGIGLGTLGFIAPEQLDSAKHVDHRADLYSIGACLYRMLAARKPVDLFLLRPGDRRLEGFHPALQHVLIRATRHRRELRYATVNELAADLEAALACMPIPDEPHPLLRPSRATPPPVPSALVAHAVQPRAGDDEPSGIRRLVSLIPTTPWRRRGDA